MLKIIKKEGKSKEIVLNELLEENNLKVEDIFYNESFVEGKLFKASKCIIEAVEVKNLKEEMSSILKQLGSLMNLNVESEILIHDNICNVTLVSNNNNILIGRDGKTLNSLQTILRQAMRKEINLDLKINVDVANYKVKKLKSIEREIKIIAREVEQTKTDSSLEPMNSYERRMVHNIINDNKNLYTESIGEGRERHIVIKYKEV